MAEPLATYDEWMAGLNQPAGTIPQANTQQSYSGTPAAAPPAAPAPAQPAQGAGDLQHYSVSSAPAPSSYAGLFGGVEQGTQKAQEQLGGLKQGFMGEAGPERTWEGIGGAGTVLGAAETGQGLDEAAKLLSAQYQGPTSLDTTKLGELQNAISGLYSQAGALGSTSGLQGLLQAQTPGLGLGAAHFEAERLSSDDMRRQAAQQKGALQRLRSQTEVAGRQAQDYAAARAEQEQSIAEQAQAALEGRQGEIRGQLEERAAGERTKQQALQNLYEQYRTSGDLGALAGLEAQLEPNKAAAAAEYQQKLATIMADPRYAAIAGLPEMARSEGPGTQWMWDDQWWGENKGKYGKKKWNELKRVAHARQKEIEALGERPYSVSELAKYQERTGAAKGRYEDIMSQYQDIANMPLMELGVSGRGTQTYSVVDPETGRLVNFQKFRKQNPELAQKLYDRQQALEAAFGQKVNPRAARGGKAQRFKSHQQEAGEFRDVLPLYKAGEATGDILERLYRPQETQPYVAYTPGPEANVYNVATPEEQEMYNRIAGMLGSPEELYQAEVKPGMGELEADVGRLLGQEQAALSERGGELTEEQKRFLRNVNKARKAHRSRPGGLLADVRPLVAPAAGFALGGLPGAAIGAVV